MKFIGEAYQQTFKKTIPILLKSTLTPQISNINLSSDDSQPNTILKINEKVSTPFDEEKIKILNNNKVRKIKNTLIESLKNKNVVTNNDVSNIDFKSFDDMIKKFKFCVDNILCLHKNEILHYVILGKITYHIKIMFPVNWNVILKKKKIPYSTQYLNFLIQLYNLFDAHEVLYNSSLNVTFFRQNIYIIKNIMDIGL